MSRACAHSSLDDRAITPRDRTGNRAQYMAFLQRWQHVTPSTRLHGIDGTLQIVKQLEGYEIPSVRGRTDPSVADRRL